MRIVQVVTTGQFAGTERYAVDVSRELEARGNRVAVVGGDPKRMRPLLGGGVRWLPGASPLEAVGSLRRLGRVDIVHSHITRADFVAVATRPMTRAALVSTRHITAPRGHSAAARVLARPVQRCFAAEITVTEWMAERLHPRPTHVLLNGVPGADDVGAERSRNVLVLQRLDAEKKTDVAIQAWAASGLAARGWRLRIAGDGAERPTLQRLADVAGVGDSVEFLGWVADVEALWADTAVLLAPPPAEPFGLSIVEAMAHGVPVIAAGAGGVIETLGAAGGTLFPPGDADRAGALLAALAADHGARRREAQRLRAHQRARLSIERHVEVLESIYAGLRPGR